MAPSPKQPPPNPDASRHFDVNMYLAGIIPCPFCFIPFEIADKNLDIHPCPYCGKSVFIPRKIHDYVLYQEIGKGGVGRVFKAAKLTGSARFAVKLARTGVSPEAARHHPLLREAEAGRALGTHPNIIEIIDFGICGDDVYLVSPFVEGTRLDQIIRMNVRFGERRGLEILRQLLDAELHIAAKGYLYRDVKPENILVEPSGNVRLLDYGICIPNAQAMAPPEIPSDEFEGSPYYIPPERIRGLPENQSSEIYSLGMLLFHMLNGKPYWTSTARELILHEHLLPDREPVSARLACSRETCAMIDRMIAADPANRHPSLALLLDELSEALDLSSKTPTVLLRRSEILRRPRSQG
jgi:serine/threonine protein kinase